MDQQAYSVPHSLREEFVYSDTFVARLKKHGWTPASIRPTYTDPLVIHQTWLTSPRGTTYTDRDFYYLFGIYHFRAVLRALLATRHPITHDILLTACPDKEQLTTYLKFLRDQDMLLHTKQAFLKGPALTGIHNIGHTLEWWCAEWFRRSYTNNGLLPVRHGVTLTELLAEGDEGDLDVIALLNDTRVFLECKSSLFCIGSTALQRFFWRAAFFQPHIALLLIDTSPIYPVKALHSIHRKLTTWQLFQTSETSALYWNSRSDIQVQAPAGRSISWQSSNIYTAITSPLNDLGQVLTAVLHHNQLHSLRGQEHQQ